MYSGKNVSFRTRALVLTALFSALSCAATLVVHIPSPTGGYMNLGDTVVLLGAYLLGGAYGAAAGALGSALADLISGAMVYVPATLVIKGLMALLASWLYRRLGERKTALLAAGAAAELVMVAGYWLCDSLLSASMTAALAGIPSNLIQAVFGIAASTLLQAPLKSALSRNKS